MGKSISVRELVAEFDLERLDPDADESKPITVSDINRPGLALSGFTLYHPAERVQLLGKNELAFFDGMEQNRQRVRAEVLCKFQETPCLIVARGLEIPKILLETAQKYRLPVLRSPKGTTKLASQLQRFLDLKLAPETLVHGVLVDVYGIGMLIMGSSGVGKSETALELVKRGHRLVADDAVEIRCVEDTLVGESPSLLKNMIEIRGLGILNAMTLFGAGAVRTHKKIEMAVKLELWQEGHQYDRVGLEEQTIRILDVELPSVTLPVHPGRNIAVILEVAAVNQRLKRMGYNAAKELSDKLMQTLEEQSE